MNVSRYLLCPLFAMVLLSGCAGLRPEPPQVSLSALQVQEVSLSHVTMLADLRLFNPNRMGLTVQEIDYTLQLAGVKIATGRNVQAFSIAAQDYGDVSLRLSTSYWDIFQLYNRLQRQGGDPVSFLLDGHIKTGGSRLMPLTFPFRKEGVMSLPPLGQP